MTHLEPPLTSLPFAWVRGKLVFLPGPRNHFELFARHLAMEPDDPGFPEALTVWWGSAQPRLGRAWHERGQLMFYITEPLTSPEMSEAAPQDSDARLRAAVDAALRKEGVGPR